MTNSSCCKSKAHEGEVSTTKLRGSFETRVWILLNARLSCLKILISRKWRVTENFHAHTVFSKTKGMNKMCFGSLEKQFLGRGINSKR